MMFSEFFVIGSLEEKYYNIWIDKIRTIDSGSNPKLLVLAWKICNNSNPPFKQTRIVLGVLSGAISDQSNIEISGYLL